MDKEKFEQLMLLLNTGKTLKMSLHLIGHNRRVLDNITDEQKLLIYETIKFKKFQKKSSRVTTVLTGIVKDKFYNDLKRQDIKETELLCKIVRNHYK